MNKNKYLFGLIGLTLGFAVSFFLTQNYNRNNSVTATGARSASGPHGGGGAGDQKAMMEDVSATLQKAKDNPKDFNAQVAAASMFAQIGRDGEAVEYLKKALDINTKDPRAFAMAAYIVGHYSEEKNYAEADKWLDRAMEIGADDPEAYVEFADMFIQRQPPNPDKAIQLLDRALKARPKDGHALGHLIEAHLLKKDARAAEETLNRLKEAEPNNQRISIYQNLLADLRAGKPITIPKE